MCVCVYTWSTCIIKHPVLLPCVVDWHYIVCLIPLIRHYYINYRLRTLKRRRKKGFHSCLGSALGSTGTAALFDGHSLKSALALDTDGETGCPSEPQPRFTSQSYDAVPVWLNRSRFASQSFDAVPIWLNWSRFTSQSCDAIPIRLNWSRFTSQSYDAIPVRLNWSKFTSQSYDAIHLTKLIKIYLPVLWCYPYQTKLIKIYFPVLWSYSYLTKLIEKNSS